MKDPKESGKKVVKATGDVIKAPVNIIVGTITGDPIEGIDKAVDNIGDAIDNIGDAISGFFD